MQEFQIFANIIFLRRLRTKASSTPPTRQLLDAMFRRLESLSTQPNPSQYDDLHQIGLLRAVLGSSGGFRDPEQQNLGHEFSSVENLAFLCDLFNLSIRGCCERHEYGDEPDCDDEPETLEVFDEEKAADILGLSGEVIVWHNEVLDDILTGKIGEVTTPCSVD